MLYWIQKAKHKRKRLNQMKINCELEINKPTRNATLVVSGVLSGNHSLIELHPDFAHNMEIQSYISHLRQLQLLGHSQGVTVNDEWFEEEIANIKTDLRGVLA